MNVKLIKKTSRTRYLHQSAKLSAKENHLAKLILTTQGGSWQVNQELIAFLSIERLGEKIVLLDMFDNPITVNRLALLTECINTYTNVMSSWANALTIINDQR
jgi:hypothetical protein